MGTNRFLGIGEAEFEQIKSIVLSSYRDDLIKRIKLKKMKIEMCNDYSALLSERINFDDGYDAATDEIIDII